MGPRASLGPRRASALLMAGLMLIGCPEQPQPDDDDDATEPPASSSATIGPEGGSVSLPDGTTLVVPEGAVPVGVLFTISETDPETTNLDDRFQRVGTAFLVSPHLASDTGFTLVIPASVLPNDAEPDDISLVISGDGLAETWDADMGQAGTQTRHHLPTSPAAADAEAASFVRHALSAATYQPMILAPFPVDSAIGGSPAWSHEYLDTMIGHPCSELLDVHGGIEAPGVDELVHLNTDALLPGLAAQWANYEDDPDLRAVLVDSVDRFMARTCQAMARSHDHFVFDLVLGWVGAQPVDVALDWERRDDDFSCARTGGIANGEGITLYVNMLCLDPYLGFHPSIDFYVDDVGPRGFAGLNTPTPDAATFETHIDVLEGIVAHELFHWFQWTADDCDGFLGWDGDTSARGFFVEGTANWAAEEAFDGVLRFPHYPLKLWTTDLLSDEAKYYSHPFWRYLEWTRDDTSSPGDSVASQVLWGMHVRADAWRASHPDGDCEEAEDVAPGLIDIDLAIEDLYAQSAVERDLAGVLPDFAAAWLFTHDFERAVEPEDDFDRHADSMGLLLPEEGHGYLWGPWTTTLTADLDTITDPDLVGLAPGLDWTDNTVTTTMKPRSARAIDVDLTGPLSQAVVNVQLEFAAVAGSDGAVSHLGVRLFRRMEQERAQLLWAIGALPDEGSTSTVVEGPLATGGLVAILANTGDAEVTVTVGAAPVTGGIAVVGRGLDGGTLALFQSEETALVPAEGLPGPDPFGLPVSAGGWDFAIDPESPGTGWVTSWDGTIDWFGLNPGDEGELDADQDPETTDDGAPPGISRIPVGEFPRGIATTHGVGLPRALVATADGVAVVDLGSRQLVGVLSSDDMGLMPGERPTYIEISLDDTKAWVGVTGSYSDPSFAALRILDVPALTDGVLNPDAVLAPVEFFCDAARLALSHAGTMLAIPCSNNGRVYVLDTTLDVLVDIAPSDTGLFFPNLDESSGTGSASSVAWSAEDTAVYVTLLSGSNTNNLWSAGVVRRCRLETQYCGKQVPFGSGSGRDVAVTGEGEGTIVWATDSDGNITPLTDDLFDPTQETQGHDVFSGQPNDTGGCVTLYGGIQVADPCPPAFDLGGIEAFAIDVY